MTVTLGRCSCGLCCRVITHGNLLVISEGKVQGPGSQGVLESLSSPACAHDIKTKKKG